MPEQTIPRRTKWSRKERRRQNHREHKDGHGWRILAGKGGLGKRAVSTIRSVGPLDEMPFPDPTSASRLRSALPPAASPRPPILQLLRSLLRLHCFHYLFCIAIIFELLRQPVLRCYVVDSVRRQKNLLASPAQTRFVSRTLSFIFFAFILLSLPASFATPPRFIPH